ncbi:MAG: hypothetical protein U9R54_05915 [Bacteroidota bacterium]|nr:hypothetical protein [Bacteroidota bacterium]
MKNWSVENNVFDDEKLDKLMHYLINDIIDEFEKLIPTGPQLGYKKIKIVNDPLYGPTFYWPLKPDHYRIGLNVSGLYYNQIAFQFSQEFSKLYCDPRISNWLIEIMAHISALYILGFLSKKWEKEFPDENLNEYFHKFREYKNNLVGSAFSKVDIVKYQVSSNWIENQVEKLRKRDKLNRGKILIIAFELLPLFKEDKELWKLLPYIGKYNSPPPSGDANNLDTNRNAVPDFENLVKNVPDKLQEGLTKLLNKFGIN